MNLTALSAKLPTPAPVLKPPRNEGPFVTGLLSFELVPSLYPVDEKAADDPPSLLPVSDEARETALRSADGFAPRMVSTTEPFFRTRKVGIL